MSCLKNDTSLLSFILILGILLISVGCGDNDDGGIAVLTWEKTFGKYGWNLGNSVKQTSDGGYVVVGTYKEGSFNDVYLIKTDKHGNIEWERIYSGTTWDWGNDVLQTLGGDYIITGAKDGDVYLLITDSEGTPMLEKTFDKAGSESGNSVQQTTDGGFIIAGYTQSYDTNKYDVYLIKVDSNGNVVWEKTFGESQSEEKGQSVQQTMDGGYIITGEKNRDVYLIKTDTDGYVLWEKTFGGADYDQGHSVQLTSDGGYIIAGGTGYDFFAKGLVGDIYLIKTDTDGNVLWEKTFGGADYDKGYSVQQTSDDGYIIVGIGDFNVQASSGDVYLIKTDFYGNTVWEKILGEVNTYETGHSVQQTSDGGYIIVGDKRFYNFYNEYTSHIYLLKTDLYGNIE